MAYAAPVVQSITVVDEGVCLLTAGGSFVRITGTNFGRIVDAGLQTVTYSGSGYTYTAENCSLVVDHSEVDCYATVGFGADLTWAVAVAGLMSNPPSTSYEPPIITGLACMSSSPCGGSILALGTAGGDVVVVTGEQFPPLGFDVYLSAILTPAPSVSADGVSAVSLPVLTTTACVVVEAYTVVHCVTPRGVGANYSWQLVVAGQVSPYSNVTTSYAPPVVTLISPNSVPTPGIVQNLNGTNLGYTGMDPQLLVVTINGTAVPFVTVSSDTSIAITVPTGEGGPYYVTAYVGNRLAGVFPFNYTLPQLSSLLIVAMNDHVNTSASGILITLLLTVSPLLPSLCVHACACVCQPLRCDISSSVTVLSI